MIQVSKIPSSTGANGELNVEAIRPNDLLAAILDWMICIKECRHIIITYDMKD